MRQLPERQRLDPSSPFNSLLSGPKEFSFIEVKAASITLSSLRDRRLTCRRARLLSVKSHFMPPLVEGHVLAPSKLSHSFLDRVAAVTGLGFFLELTAQLAS